MLSRSALEMILCFSAPSERRMALPPSGSTRPVVSLPPDAQVENLVQAAGRVGELALVNDQPRVVGSRQNRGNDLVEGHRLGLDIRIEDLQRQISRGQRARNRDLDAFQVSVSSLRLETIIGP